MLTGRRELAVAVMFLALVVVLHLAAGCASRPPVAMPAAAAADVADNTPWCFAAVASKNGVDVDALSCWSEAWACATARSLVEDHAGLIGVVSLTETCEER